MDAALVAELAAMVEVDQRLRTPPPGGERKFARFLSLEERMEWNRIDVGNTDRLREIVREHGWPGRSLVGEDGCHNAWLLAQHADRQLDFQREALALLAQAVAAEDASAKDLAYLTDRVRMNEGREQLYGTQIADVTDGRAVPWPIEDPERLDERRAAAGLERFADYVARWSEERES